MFNKNLVKLSNLLISKMVKMSKQLFLANARDDWLSIIQIDVFSKSSKSPQTHSNHLHSLKKKTKHYYSNKLYAIKNKHFKKFN